MVIRDAKITTPLVAFRLLDGIPEPAFPQIFPLPVRNRKHASLKQIMEELDLQKRMEEAAKERSSITKALLNIQHSHDQIGVAVLKLEPVVHDISAWHPGVDAAVVQLQADIGATQQQPTIHTDKHTRRRPKLSSFPASRTKIGSTQ